METLLAMVEQDRDARARAVLATAEKEAQQIIREARHNATVRVRQAVRQSRMRAREQVDSVRADLVTRARLREQELYRAALERAWPDLVSTLEQRWLDAPSRQQWIEDLVQRASECLPADVWRVEIAPGCKASENDAACTAILSRTGHEPECVVVPALRVGLRVTSGGVVLDGSLTGLLADQIQIQSRLLAALAQEESESQVRAAQRGAA
jgi:hypothetical protein